MSKKKDVGKMVEAQAKGKGAKAPQKTGRKSGDGELDRRASKFVIKGINE